MLGHVGTFLDNCRYIWTKNQLLGWQHWSQSSSTVWLPRGWITSLPPLTQREFETFEKNHWTKLKIVLIIEIFKQEPRIMEWLKKVNLQVELPLPGSWENQCLQHFFFFLILNLDIFSWHNTVQQYSTVVQLHDWEALTYIFSLSAQRSLAFTNFSTSGKNLYRALYWIYTIRTAKYYTMYHSIYHIVTLPYPIYLSLFPTSINIPQYSDKLPMETPLRSPTTHSYTLFVDVLITQMKFPEPPGLAAVYSLNTC